MVPTIKTTHLLEHTGFMFSLTLWVVSHTFPHPPLIVSLIPSGFFGVQIFTLYITHLSSLLETGSYSRLKRHLSRSNDSIMPA